MCALAAATTPDSSSAIVDFVPELSACDADIEAFDIGANGVAALTPTRCSTDCLNDNFNQGSEGLLMSYCVLGSSHGGRCQKKPWPPPQVMSLTGIYGTATIPTEQHFYSQLLFHSDQSGGSSCMTWDSGGLPNCTLLSHKANNQVFGYKNVSIQCLLHQLLVDSSGIRIDMRSPKNYGPASQSTDTVAADVSDDYE
ncbi:hypothetical protein ZWY2020_057026 [Hordeum vulgare]|nr:hypothetical protein ZWY2020_057026 [Hordeum vulgare]